MSLLRTARRASMRPIAWLLNDRRPLPPYSYAWLNRECARLVARNPGAMIRPAYAWGTLQAAALGRALHLPRVSVVEFGVAGGRGLVALEQIAAAVETLTGVGIDVYGFDTGEGLPKPTDPRDHPNLYVEGGYRMDVPALRAKLRRAHLVLGDVKDTVPDWVTRGDVAPVGFVSWDLDYYSSTMDAFNLLRLGGARLLPRVVSYFDDVMGMTFGDCVGERRAIADFNREQPNHQLSPIYGLRYLLPWPLSTEKWPDMMFLAHLLDHPRYGDFDGLAGPTQAPLAGAAPAPAPVPPRTPDIAARV